MAGSNIEIAPQGHMRWNGQQQESSRQQQSMQITQNLYIVFQMFEHVEQTNEIELGREVDGVNVTLDQAARGAFAREFQTFLKQIHACYGPLGAFRFQHAQHVTRTTP